MDGAINIVVYDSTNVARRGVRTIGERMRRLCDATQWLTFWWRLGARMRELQGFADYSIGAATWTHALAEVGQAVERHRAITGRPTTIASLQFWGHGLPGHAFLGLDPPSMNARTLAPGGLLFGPARQIGKLLHPRQGHVWFRCCSPFAGVTGLEFARAAAAAFGVPVVGHTFTIHLVQSGTRVLRPGQIPDWNADEGIHQRGRRRGTNIVSAPWHARTVSMFRLRPPIHPE